MRASIALQPQMALSLVGVMVGMYLLMMRYMRGRVGPQPGYAGLLVMFGSMAGFLILFAVLRRAGVDLLHGRPRDIFWLVLGIVWLVFAGRGLYQRRYSGAVLMDLGRSPMFKIQIASAALLTIVAIQLALSAESWAHAFAYFMWSAWFLVMASGRFEVRDGGLLVGVLVPWSRIVSCAPTVDDKVRLTLKKGLKRTVDLRLPADRHDGFIELVQSQTGAHSAPGTQP